MFPGQAGIETIRTTTAMSNDNMKKEEIVAECRAIAKAAKEQTSEINRSAKDKIIALKPELELVPITRVNEGIYTAGLIGNDEVAEYEFTCCVCLQDRMCGGNVIVKNGKPAMVQVGVAIVGAKPGEGDVCIPCVYGIDPVMGDRLSYAMYLLEGDDVTSPKEAIAKAYEKAGGE